MTTSDNMYSLMAASFQDAGVTRNRTNPVPLDKTSVFKTYDNASEYALTSVVSYPGQVVAVLSGDQKGVYVLDPASDTGLTKLATAAGGDTSELLAKLNGEISGRLSADSFLSSEIDNLLSATLPTLSTTLNENLSIDVRVEAKDGCLSSYVISQGGADKTITIDIPKDKVVDKADVVSFETDADAQAATGDAKSKAGTYLKLTVQNGQNVFVPVPELVNTYSGANSETVNLYVYQDELSAYKISADVKAGSIGADHLTTTLSTYIEAIKTSVENLGTDTLSTLKTVSADLSTDYTGKIDSLSTVVETLSNDLSAAISSEVDRATGIEGELSDAIENKVMVGDYG